MGQVIFKSPEQVIPAPREDVYHFISDLRNFESLMPDQVEKWSADRDRCEFTVTGLSTINMEVTGRSPGRVNLKSGDKSPVDFELECSLTDNGNSTVAMITLNTHLSPMIKMMASRPLQNLVNIMAERLSGHFNS